MKLVFSALTILVCTLAAVPSYASKTILAVFSKDKSHEAIIRETTSKESTIEIRNSAGEKITEKDFSSKDGEQGLTIDFALWSPDSQFFIFTTHSSGGHSLWQFPSFFFDRRDKKIHSFSEYLPPIADEKFTLKSPDIITLKIWTPLRPDKPLDESIELEVTFKMHDLMLKNGK